MTVTPVLTGLETANIVLRLKKGANPLGRVDIQVADKKCSRKQCEVHYDGSKVFVNALGKNNMYVQRKSDPNAKPEHLVQEKHVEIFEGDVIYFVSGRHPFKLEFQDSDRKRPLVTPGKGGKADKKARASGGGADGEATAGDKNGGKKDSRRPVAPTRLVTKWSVTDVATEGLSAEDFDIEKRCLEAAKLTQEIRSEFVVFALSPLDKHKVKLERVNHILRLAKDALEKDDCPLDAERAKEARDWVAKCTELELHNPWKSFSVNAVLPKCPFAPPGSEPPLLGEYVDGPDPEIVVTPSKGGADSRSNGNATPRSASGGDDGGAASGAGPNSTATGPPSESNA